MTNPEAMLQEDDQFLCGQSVHNDIVARATERERERIFKIIEAERDRCRDAADGKRAAGDQIWAGIYHDRRCQAERLMALAMDGVPW